MQVNIHVYQPWQENLNTELTTEEVTGVLYMNRKAGLIVII